MKLVVPPFGVKAVKACNAHYTGQYQTVLLSFSRDLIVAVVCQWAEVVKPRTHVQLPAVLVHDGHVYSHTAAMGADPGVRIGNVGGIRHHSE